MVAWVSNPVSVSPILAKSLGSLGAGILTAVGAMPMLVVRKVSARWQDVLLGFAAGVMLAAMAIGRLNRFAVIDNRKIRRADNGGLR